MHTFPNLKLVKHPLIAHKLTLMRDKNTSSLSFRQLLHEIALLVGFDMTRDLPLTTAEIETPVTKATLPVLDGTLPVIVPILRAGLGMSQALGELLPTASFGHIGVYRDEETHQPKEYLVKLPTDIANRPIWLVDPMLATGGSAIHAINILAAHGVPRQSIKFMVLVAAPEGVKALQDAAPEVQIYAAALDEKLNENAYIVPGLGDAGDRIFGTV